MPIPLFKDIGKKLKDHLTKKFDDEQDRGKLFTGQVLKFSTKNDEGVKIDSYTRYMKGAFVSELNTEYKREEGTVSLKLNSGNKVELCLKTKKIYEGLSTAITVKAAKSKPHSGVLDLQYKQPFFTVQGKFESQPAKSSVKTEVSCVMGEGGLAVGVKHKGKVNTATRTADLGGFADLSTAVQLTLGDMECTLINMPKSEVELGFFKTVSSKTKLGGKYHVPPDTKDPKLSLGVAHTLSADTSLYGVFDSTGSLKGTVSQKFTDLDLTGSLTFGMDLTKGVDLIQPVGIAVTLGQK